MINPLSTFLNGERRTKVITTLMALGMPRLMAEEFASWPDNTSEVDVHLTAIANQLVEYKEKIEAGDHSVDRLYAADLVLLCVYMEEAAERDLDENDLPLVDAAFVRHNAHFEAQKRCQ